MMAFRVLYFGEVFCSLILVGLLWGATNPFIKRASAGVEHIQTQSSVTTFICELKFLAFNWRYMVPFLLNQSGSILYFFTLQKADLSLAVPVANSLTFVFTAFTGWALGEDPPNKGTIWGMILVIAGISLCMLDKVVTSAALEKALTL